MEENLSVLKIVSDFFNDRKSELYYEKLDWNIIAKLSHIHQISGLVFEQLKEGIPKPFSEAFETAYFSSLFIYLSRQDFIAQLKTELNKTDIKYFFVKGVVIAEYYKVPALRTMGDIDLIVSDREKAHVILERLGFNRVANPPDKEWIYRKGDFELELHFSLVYDEFSNKNVIDEYLKNCFDFVSDNELDLNFHFIYTVLHLRKHLLNNGVGIRQFLDVAYFSRQKGLNFELIKKQLKELEIYDFTRVLFAFLKRWFQVESPFEEIEIDEEFYTFTTEQILKNGVFGFQNDDNKYNNIVNYHNNEKKKSKFAFFISSVFPSYKTLCNSQKYSFIIGKKILLPFVWVYRWITLIPNIFKPKKIAEKGMGYVPKDKKESRDKYIQGWKL